MAAVNNSIQVHLNSRDAKRLNSSFNSHLEFNLPMIQYTTFFTLFLSIAHAAIPYSFYAINETNNILNYSLITFDDDTTNNETITLRPGNYTSGSLISELQQLLGANFNVSYSDVTNKVTFKHITNDIIFYQVNNSILSILGFDVETYTYFSSNKKVLTCDFMLNLFTVRNLCISTLFITENVMSKNKSSTILCSIPITTTPYTVINYINLIDHKVNLDTNIFNHIIIKITDQDGNFLNLNNQHFNITLQIDVVEI